MKKGLIIAGIVAAGLAAVLTYGQVNKTITIELTAEVSGDVIDAYAWQFDYKAEIPDGEGGMIPNPESKGAFASRMFTEQAQNNIRSIYKSYKTYQGSTAAAAQADADSLGITVQ